MLCFCLSYGIIVKWNIFDYLRGLVGSNLPIFRSDLCDINL